VSVGRRRALGGAESGKEREESTGGALGSLTGVWRALAWPGLYGWVGVAFALAGLWFLPSGLVLRSKAALLGQKGAGLDPGDAAFAKKVGDAREFLRLRDSYIDLERKKKQRKEKESEREEIRSVPQLAGRPEALERAIESLAKRIAFLTKDIEKRERKLGLAGLGVDEFRRRYEAATAPYYELKAEVLSPAESARGLGFGEHFLGPVLRDLAVTDELVGRFGRLPGRELRELWDRDTVERARMTTDANARASLVFGAFCLAVSGFWWGFRFLDPATRAEDGPGDRRSRTD
jgi:hypothetical protein